MLLKGSWLSGPRDHLLIPCCSGSEISQLLSWATLVLMTVKTTFDTAWSADIVFPRDQLKVYLQVKITMVLTRWQRSTLTFSFFFTFDEISSSGAGQQWGMGNTYRLYLSHNVSPIKYDVLNVNVELNTFLYIADNH